MNLGITQNLTETGYSGIRIRKKNRKRSAQKRKNKKPKENQKEIGLVVLSALFLGSQTSGRSAARFWERFWKDSKVSNGFTKKVSNGIAQ